MFEELDLTIAEAGTETEGANTTIHTNAHTCTTNTCSEGKLCC